MRAAIHIDLDGATDIFRVHGWKYSGETDPLFESGLRNALEFFGQNGVRATLFVIAQDLENKRKRELLAEAVQCGHEVGSHSITHRHLTKLSRAEKRHEIFCSRERLSEALGVEVLGFRAPGFCIDRESLEFIAAAGYRYDSSTFPNEGFARKVGAASLSALPSRPLADCDLIEFCLPAHDPLPFSFHPCFSLLLGTPYFRIGLRRFAKRKAPMILLFHLTDFADPLPSSWLPGFAGRIYTLSHLSARRKFRACSQMLQLVKDRFEVVPTKELLAGVTIS
jgi:hypothetical protein